MIPEFPKFKKLELSDKKDIEKLTHKLPPYADFNFVNMWAWDFRHQLKVSQLHKNLVVFFTDYISKEQFFTFIGENNLPETATELIAYSMKYHKVNVLKFVPEEIAHALERAGFSVVPDRDNFDYIYSVSHLAQMNSWPGSGISKRIRQFAKVFPEYVVKYSSLQDLPKDDYVKIFRKWAKHKEYNSHFELDEFKAFERFLEIKDKNIEIVSLHLDDCLVGFTAYEILPHHCALSHFVKADYEFSGITDVLNWEEAKRLLSKDVRYYNWEQDLGIPGLRHSKEKYSPSLLMKKFVVRHK